MGKNNPTAVDLQKQLNAADEKTDLKVLAQTAISCLAEAEATIKELQAKPDAAEVQIQLDSALVEISKLGEKLDLQEKTKDMPGIPVTVGGENKLLIGKKFKRNGKEFTADEVAKDQDHLDWLHKIRSGSLVDPSEFEKKED
jgi:hypothetical protein